ncbi:MAG: hypothetical protein M3174_01320 [Actinomycetota bacterium]|nr:hypothetical protein [Actinomycetota bacterium]
MNRKFFALMATVVALGLTPAASGGPGPHGISTDNVKHVAFVPFEVGTATGARIVGKYLYVTSWKSFSIYDVSNPANPQLESITPFEFKFENEDVATNGKILIFSEELPNRSLHVWDVRDKADPKKIATADGLGQHTMSCVDNCKWLYGSDGFIIDLRKPSKPKLLSRRWGEDGTSNAHDVIQVGPNRVLTASDPIQLLDTSNPAKPKIIARSQLMNEFVHSVQWPNAGKDDFILATGETWFPGADALCTDSTAGFSTWNAKNYKKTRTFQMIDIMRPSAGTYVNGSPPVNAPFGCSTHWFQQHPKFKNGGLVAAGFYNHGTRFLKVSKKGRISEAGWFVPHGGGTSAAYWRNKRFVYAIDYQRGFDVLKYTGKL